MLAQPSMIKRPVLEFAGGKLTVGFTPERSRSVKHVCGKGLSGTLPKSRPQTSRSVTSCSVMHERLFFRLQIDDLGEGADDAGGVEIGKPRLVVAAALD